MRKVLVSQKHFEDIASAIRSKNGESTLYKPGDMAHAIRLIPTGGGSVLETLNVTENGLYTPDDGVYGYGAVSVNVNTGYRPLPHYARLTNGWVGQGGDFWFGDTSVYPLDLYRVQANHMYIIGNGTHYGNRFRLVFTTVDVSQYTRQSYGSDHVSTSTIILTDNQNGPMATSYTPYQDGYIVVYLTNQTNTIYSYAFDFGMFDGLTIDD